MILNDTISKAGTYYSVTLSEASLAGGQIETRSTVHRGARDNCSSASCNDSCSR
jgi:hypothetical protein